MNKTISIAVCVAAFILAAWQPAFAADPVQTYSLGTTRDANAEGYLFSYESLVQSPGDDGHGNVYLDWWYDYYLENNSMNHQIVSWVWSYGGRSGAVMPNPHGNTDVAPGSSSLPLAPAPTTDILDALWRDESFRDPNKLFQVTSTITWEDQHQSQADIYVPQNLVPGGGGTIALASGLVGFLGALSRRRR